MDHWEMWVLIAIEPMFDSLRKAVTVTVILLGKARENAGCTFSSLFISSRNTCIYVKKYWSEQNLKTNYTCWRVSTFFRSFYSRFNMLDNFNKDGKPEIIYQYASRRTRLASKELTFQ